MQQLNNLDVVILIIIGISALIALSRGLIKEVLSIIGWFLAVMSVVYLLPVTTPFAEKYIESSSMAAVATSFIIVILFFIIWILLTGSIVSKVKKSKLGNIDRILGLFFGIFRAFLLVVLFYILVNWMVPVDKQSEALTKSKYYNLAGSFAKPIEELIPADTLEKIREKTKSAGVGADEEKAETSTETEEKNSSKALFEMLTQPKVGKKKDEPVAVIDNALAIKAVEVKKQIEKATPKAEEKGYNEHERDNLDRLIENTAE